MKIYNKLDEIQKLIGDICEVMSNEQPSEDDEEAKNKLNEITSYLDMAYDQIEDIRSAYEAYQDYIEADHEPFYFNNSYNGVSEKDFA